MQPASRLSLNRENPDPTGQQDSSIPADEAPRQMGGQSWDVEGDGFILQGYRPPGEQMALGRRPMMSLPSGES